MVSCSSKSGYTNACSSNPSANDKKGTVSGKEISTTRVKRSTYRNFSRRPVKLGLLRK